jgi:GMP synthase-like glutamine amidotransferase
MRIHWLQHVPFEGLGSIEGWLAARGHPLACTRLYAKEAPPVKSENFDWLIVMGGPMSVHQGDQYPWLRPEKRLIVETVAAGKRVLGICLGAQLVAEALGGKVCPNGEREIGWFPVHAVPGGAASPFNFPVETRVFHWHADTFSLPPGAVWLAKSDGCSHQAFAVGSRVLGLQFHVETTAADIRRMVDACPDDLGPGRYVQPASEMITEDGRDAAELLDWLLSVLESG